MNLSELVKQIKTMFMFICIDDSVIFLKNLKTIPRQQRGLNFKLHNTQYRFKYYRPRHQLRLSNLIGKKDKSTIRHIFVFDISFVFPFADQVFVFSIKYQCQCRY